MILDLFRLLRQRAGRSLRALRGAVDGALHPWRRRRALAALRSLPRPRLVLFVCLGNICRSPLAENVFRTTLDETETDGGGTLDIAAVSGGFIGPGRPSPPEMQDAARRRGYELDRHTSKLVSAELLRRSDLVVVMEPRQRRALRSRFGASSNPAVLVLGDLDPRRPRRRAIRDPWGQPEEVFEDVAARIECCTLELARILRADSGL